MEYIIMGMLFVIVLIFIMLIFSNRKLKKEVKVLKEALAAKDTAVSNLEASSVAVKETIDDSSSHDEVMELLVAGESRENISKKLGIPENKIDLIIKFDKIKKEKHI
jgi:hypothetical protein